MECPSREAESPTAAYEVTYSYLGQALASDEFGIKHFLFQVYFRPEELALAVQRALANKKLSRVEKASYFMVTTSRKHVQRLVIDDERSNFCSTILMDGVWTHADPDCQHRINYKTITALSDYITVRVDPVALH